MSVFIDVKSRFDDASGKKAAEEAKKYFANAGQDSGNAFTGGFAQAVERDSKVRAAADKVADSLDKITAAEAKRATAQAKSEAIANALADAEGKLTKARSLGFDEMAKSAEKDVADLRAKQIDIDNKLVVSSAAVSRANRDKAKAIREASDAYKQMGDDVDTLSSKLKGLGDGGAGFAKLNLGLTGIGLLPAAATAITEVAGALNQLAGAGFAVPGIFAGIASSVGVGALGMHGMSDAIKAVDKASDGTKTSVDAANKALAGLDPTAADVVKTVVGLKGTFTDLQHIAAGNLFSGISSDLKGLAAADLPAVTRGVNGISAALNSNLRQAIASLGSGSSQGFLDRIFGNTAAAQATLTGAINPIIHAVGELSAVGSDALPRLANDIGAVADRFDRFISAADASGKLTTWINDGITGFESLGRTVLNIGNTFESVLGAAGGNGGLINMLEQASNKLRLFVDSPMGQEKLAGFFAEGRDMLGQLKDVATEAGPVLAGVFKAGVTAADTWLPVIKDVLATINRIPGGAQAVVAAFAAWNGITAIASVATGLSKIVDLLKIAIPGAAAEGAAAASFSLGSIAATASKLLGPLALVATALGSLHFQQTQAADDDAKNHRTATVPIGPRGMPVAVDPGPNRSNAPTSNLNMSHPLGVGIPVGAGAPGPADPNLVKAEVDKRIAAATNSLGALIPTPGVSGYTDPTITSGAGGGGGAAATPFIDPSKFQAGDPLAGMPAAVAGADPQKIFEADSKLITDTHDLEQKKLALAVLEAKGNATQQELLTAKNDIQEKERSLYDSQAKDLEARNGQIKKAVSDMKDVFAPLDSDFGISKGLPGIVENLVKALGDFALGGAIKSSPTLQAAALSMQSGSGSSASGPGYGYGFSAGSGGGYAGDAALLANVPAGRYSQTGSADLTKGLGDCSSSVEDLVDILQGQPTAGRSLSTGSAPEWLPAHGFLPNNSGANVPGAFNVGFNNEHMQATLPGGTNFNYGSNAAAANRGIGGTGAFDPAFDSHYYLPTGGPSIGPAPIGGGVGPSWATGQPMAPIHGGGEGPVFSAPGPMAGGAIGAPGAAVGAGGNGFNTGVQPAANPGGGGVGITPGGTLDSALTAAASIFPGGGMAAQVAIKEANRAIQFAGQAAGIGVSGVMETLLPAGSPLAANSWFSKLAGGIAGARPASPNKAGGPNGGQPGQAPPPMGTPASGQGQGPAPGPGVTVNYTNNQATEDRAGADLTSHLTAMSSGVGH